jgi:hypothetical protein
VKRGEVSFQLSERENNSSSEIYKGGPQFNVIACAKVKCTWCK